MLIQVRFAAAMALCAALAACGGGGDDGETEVVRSSATYSEPDQANRTRNGWVRDIGSDNSAQQYTGDLRWRACVTGSVRQSLTSAAKLKLSVSVFGNRPVVVDGVQGAVGPDNRIGFSACGETFTKAVFPIPLSGSATVKISATELGIGSVDGYDITAQWVVTKLP